MITPPPATGRLPKTGGPVGMAVCGAAMCGRLRSRDPAGVRRAAMRPAGSRVFRPYRHLTVADHLPCGGPHPLRAVKEDAGDGSLGLSPPSLDVVELWSAGRQARHLHVPVRTVRALAHLPAGEGAGAVRHDARLPAAPAQVFCRPDAHARSRAVGELQIRGAATRRPDHVDGPPGVAGGHRLRPRRPAPLRDAGESRNVAASTATTVRPPGRRLPPIFTGVAFGMEAQGKIYAYRFAT